MYTYCFSYKFRNAGTGFRVFNAKSFWEAFDILNEYLKSDGIDDCVITNIYREEYIVSNPE